MDENKGVLETIEYLNPGGRKGQKLFLGPHRVLASKGVSFQCFPEYYRDILSGELPDESLTSKWGVSVEDLDESRSLYALVQTVREVLGNPPEEPLVDGVCESCGQILPPGKMAV